MIAFFASKVRRFSSGHLAPFSSVIRAEQPSRWLGAKLNPIGSCEDYTCIYVKSFVYHKSAKSYVDIVDGWGLLSTLRAHPEVPIIVCSKLDYQVLAACLSNKIVLIPQHSCNYERYQRRREGVTRIGMIGTASAWKYLPEGLEGILQSLGFELELYESFNCRDDVVHFYQNIDLQIIWRPYFRHLSNPLKLINAMSFGVPTVAFYEQCFDEVGECYVPVTSSNQLIDAVLDMRRSTSRYAELAHRGVDAAEPYHISKIAKLYEALDGR